MSRKYSLWQRQPGFVVGLFGALSFVLVGGANAKPGGVDDLGHRPEVKEPEAEALAPGQASGALEGTVTFGGTSVPSTTRVVNSTDPEICGIEHSLQNLVVSTENRGIRHVIVSLTGVPEERIVARTPARLILDNRDCQFAPHVAVATVGDTIVAVNSDATLHNTHYYGILRSNIALPGRGMTASRVAPSPGLVSVLCDVHGWMKSYIRIDSHPFHAVTDGSGQFRIEGIPPGSYTVELWHETLGAQEATVVIEADEVSIRDVEYATSPN